MHVERRIITTYHGPYIKKSEQSHTANFWVCCECGYSKEVPAWW